MRPRTLPISPASPHAPRSFAIVATFASTLMAGGLAHGALKTHDSVALVSAPVTTSPSMVGIQIADGMLGDKLIARASHLASAMDFDAQALLLGTAGEACSCRELVDWTRSTGLGAWNCDEREHFRASAAIRSSLGEGLPSSSSIASIASIALR
ncbi:MAG: hypothetical protein LW806_01275, partial [Planctomycetaceae bacterium]|nr:hypothetical protein [Planctomycetaceae bacterium]